MIELKNVKKQYDDNVVFENLNINFENKQIKKYSIWLKKSILTILSSSMRDINVLFIEGWIQSERFIGFLRNGGGRSAQLFECRRERVSR